MKQATIDWQRAIRIGAEMAADYCRAGSAITDEAIMWALLCDAAKTSALAGRHPPYQGYPGKSSMPDAPDEISMWQKISAYIRGEVEEMPEADSRPPRPSAEAISRSDAVLHVWHTHVTLGRQKKRAVYIRACGGKPGLARRITGLDVTAQKAAKRRAMGEMMVFICKPLTNAQKKRKTELQSRNM